MVKWIISGRRWFDKINGNTYHSVSITNARNNKTIFKSGRQYGYGDQYKQTATDYLRKKGYIKAKDEYNYDKNRKDFFIDVSDVSRQKDLDDEQLDLLKENKSVILANKVYDKDREMKAHLHKQKMIRLQKKFNKR